MGGFLKTSKTVTVKDTYKTGGVTYYQQASVEVEVSSAGKVSWKISMTNDHGGSRGRAVYLTVSIGGKTIQGPGYTRYPNDIDERWLTYPTGNGTSKSGSFTLNDNTTSSLSISVYVCCMQNSTSAGKTVTETLTRTKWTDVGKGTVTITDNGNNTFSVSGTKGANGTNNTASGPTLSWGYDTDYGKSVSNPINLTIATPANATRTVYAKGITEATYGSDATVTTSLAIKQYVAPGDPGKPVLSYSKSRLTTKENWTFTWTAAKATNTSSPVKGYRIRLYKNGVLIPIKNNSGSLLSELRSGTAADWIYDANITSLTINPVIHEFAAGDTVVLSLYAYAVNGKGTTNHWSGGGTSAVYSDTYTVQNAGIVRVKVGSEWKEGQVYIKANGAWKEAETVSTRVGGQWKEAE
jgi:hypothetical protein